MGKGILLIVAAVMLGGLYLIRSGQQSALETASEQGMYESKVVARDIAQSGIDRAVSAIKRDLMAAPMTYDHVAHADGRYDVHIVENLYGDLSLDAEGRLGAAWHEVRANVIFEAPIDAPLQISAENLDLTESGSYLVSGVDKRAPSRVNGQSQRAFLRPVHGVVTDAKHAGYLRNRLEEDNVTSVEGGFNKAYYEQLYEEALQHAQYVGSESALRNLMASSDAGNPKIARVDGDFSISGEIDGHGLLIVEDGNLSISSDAFNWEGLVLVRKQNLDTLDVQLSGGQIHGGFVVYEQLPNSCGADFEINGNSTVPLVPYRLDIKVLGAAITYGAGGYDMPVTARIKIGDTSHYPWGDWGSPVEANLNNGGSFAFTPDSMFAAETPIRIDARSWVKKSSSYDGSQDSHWKQFLEKDSRWVDDQLAVLRDGSPVPGVGGFDGQTSAEEFVEDYIAGSQMTMEDFQSIYLFELGSTNPSSPAHDMQDLVLLVTMTTACDPSEQLLQFAISSGAEIHYSAEAIAKLGKVLNKIKERTTAVVAEQEERAPNPEEIAYDG